MNPDDFIYMVVWSGGFEEPDYAVKSTLEEARSLSEQWIEDSKEEDGDVVNILKINVRDLSVEKVV